MFPIFLLISRSVNFGTYVVSDAESLISSLSNVWIGKLRLHANVARYERKVNGNSSHGVRKAPGNSSHVGFKVDPQGVKKDHSGSFSNQATSYANVAKSSMCGGGRATDIDQDVKEGRLFVSDQEVKGATITLTQDISNDSPLALL
ncbi:hypothetical protein Tco_1207790 [Tanacetum coccineum]